MALAKCPKCKSNSVFYDRVLGYNRNTCLNCGTMHQPGTEFQALERQVTGHNLIHGVGDFKAQIQAGFDSPEDAVRPKLHHANTLNFDREILNASR